MQADSINASPTKRLFIGILTQDVTLKAAILDLIDNSVDSYTRNKYNDRRKIELVISPKKFSIRDECGGIKLGVLKVQVFRFGSKVDKLDNPTLGMYGIGLKRSVFKIGDDIILETDDKEDYSLMNLNVPTWESDDRNWDIPFETEKSKLTTNPYTLISIETLHKEISNQFSSVIFLNDIAETIKKTYCLIMKENIDIFLNGVKIEPYDLYVPEDENYKPSVIIDEIHGIKIRIICFLDPSQGTRLKHAINRLGWNVFCNNRLILANDTTELTGWGGAKEDKSLLPKYHSLFNEFRGMVFLDANNPFNLPLNTSKTQLNTENIAYHAILKLMVKAARPIIDYIYDSKVKQSQEIEGIEEELKNAEVSADIYNPIIKQLTNFIESSKFSAPAVNNHSSSLARISYTRDKALVDKLRNELEVKSNKEVGEKTFDYYVLMQF